jgi:hypothetical protein
MHSIYITEYCSALKKKEVLLFTTQWMSLKYMMLTETSQAQRERYCTISLYVDQKQLKSQKQGEDILVNYVWVVV